MTANEHGGTMPSGDSKQPRLTILQRPGDMPPGLSAMGMKAALELLSNQLNGIDTPRAWIPSERHEGICRACGQVTTMTFEHIPPKSAGNSVRARGASMWDIVTADDPLAFPARGWTQSQKGVGGYVFCASCNNMAGHRYVPEYAKFAFALREGIDATFQQRGHFPGEFDLTIASWHLGDIARQAVMSLMAVAVHDRLLLAYPDLKDVIRTPGTLLPASLRLGLTLVVGSRHVRVSGPVAVSGPDGCAVFSEVAMAPFSWTLGFVGDDDVRVLDRTADVTHWLGYGSEEPAPASESVVLPLGALHSSLPGDYRISEQISGDSAAPDDLIDELN
jgi:hypothetical protein